MRRLVLALSWFAIGAVVVWGQNAKDTPKAAETRKLLETKISVEYSEDLMQDVVEDLAEQIKDKANKTLPTKIDLLSGLSRNMKVSHKAKNTPLKTILNDMCKEYGFGYVVVSGKYKSGAKLYGAKYDGYLLFRKSAERGFPIKNK